MQCLKGLVHYASRDTLNNLEHHFHSSEQQRLVVKTRMMDVYGTTGFAPILHVGSLLKSLKSMTLQNALARLGSLKNELDSMSQFEYPLGERCRIPTLFVRDTVSSVQREIFRRECRILAKLEGRLISPNPVELDIRIKQMCRNAQEHEGTFVDTDVVTFHGIIEALCDTDSGMALKLALNTQLPPLNSSVAAELARLIDLSSKTAMDAFLDGFAPRDELLPAYETCATQLAIRLRRYLKKTGSATSVEAKKLLTRFHRFNIDVGIVYPEDAAAIQRWASEQGLSPAMLPCQRAQHAEEIVTRHGMRPLPVSMVSLSSWCLSDLVPSWVRASLGDLPPKPRKCDGMISSSEDLIQETSCRNARRIIRKDLRRSLINNRLLRQYGEFLRTGDETNMEKNFSSFLEECGECHDMTECPEIIEFMIQNSKVGNRRVLYKILRNLAPTCSFWVTLLDYFPEYIHVFSAPCGDLRVRILMPPAHECVQAAASTRSGSPNPLLPVLYEDEELMIINKPTGLATSRHALSSTQIRKGESIVDVVSLLLHGHRGDALLKVFRQGQVHRLDTETSGCLLVAKTSNAISSLRHQVGSSVAFKQYSKLYVALCVIVEQKLARVLLQGELNDQINSKIRTQYRVVEFFKSLRLALVECRIQQGKKHQIRRHFASAGMPIVGDLVHGGVTCMMPLMQRVALHARAITFVHPRTAEVVTVTAPLPEDFVSALEVLRKC